MELTLAPLLPFLAALLLALPAARPFVTAVAPLTAVPALWIALVGASVEPFDAPWLLLGARLVLDEIGRVFLLFTSILWIVACLFARAYLADDPRRSRFFAFLLVTMAGNLGLIVAGDMITFYVFFAVMSFASYGLIVHSGEPDVLQAGRIYIGLVIVGELLLFTGMIAAAAITGSVDLAAAPPAVAGSPSGPLVMGLLLAGFGVKVGALPLHMWLPLAHPAAPTPASAILSGAIIKAGLLGWLRFLPLGQTAVAGWGEWCVIAGLAAAFGAVFTGLTQTNPKIALAYSSISQMGFLTVGVGVGLLAPEAWPVLLPALLLYATHHGLAKGALFLSIGVVPAALAGRSWRRPLVMSALIIPALSLAGVPLTSGAVSKVALKNALDAAPLPFGALDIWLAFAAVGTTALMARFLFLVTRRDDIPHEYPSHGLVAPWFGLVGAVMLLVWVAPLGGFQRIAIASLAPQYLWSTLWPPVLGAVLAWYVWSRPGLRAWRLRLHVPPGDLIWPLLRVGHQIIGITIRWQERRPVTAAVAAVRSLWPDSSAGPFRAARLERDLTAWSMAGMLLLAILAALLALMGI